jgi:hypothetical protein
LSRLDCSVEVRGRDIRDIHVTVGQQHVKIEIDRAQSRRRHSDEKAPDRLKFGIIGHWGERMSWTDTDEQLLETQLSVIATEIVLAGELQYREHQIWLYDDAVRRREELKHQAIQQQIEREKAERERLIKLEAARLKRLTDSAESYHRAKTIRAFVSSVIEAFDGRIDPEHVERWKEWALLQAEKLDPIATEIIWDDVNDRD